MCHSTMKIPGDGPHLCVDDISGRPVMSSIAQLEALSNELNVLMLSEGDVSLNDFYNLVGLPTLPFFDNFGWNARDRISIRFTGKLSDEGEPAVLFHFAPLPMADVMGRV